MKTYFDAITIDAQGTIEFTFSSNVHNRPLTAEVCSLMDCTGSMVSWIGAGKQHIKAIADGIQNEIEENYDKDSFLRVAFVAYRDRNGPCRFDWIDFHQAPNLEPVQTKIASQPPLSDTDLCEDVPGGLDKALQLGRAKENSSRAAQILVWIGDCPGHASFCHNGGASWYQHLNGLSDVSLITEIINDINSRGIFLLLSDFTPYVQIMPENSEKKVNTIIANEFM
ncbi:unnamed protein product [Rotaria socialis]|uniref:VWFA domain-containing protein n=1 Tax=Rotaria socialis TaxID=392032 RepID=A0A818F0T7_9BILA|nr:unnamed protein product [Rotaria socialis]CAF3376678.1 unnamed protein product [Rotaria socialis]CAF3467458.1 unnamed protein product [Rotaria socialis]CAF3717881.1 unnamed protein product [Rotaria socialis]CAF4116764.1 unnamed protein product [Rotaria socialis]